MESVVEIGQGACRGVLHGSVISFKGIPYARAPYGEHRMMPPTAHQGWSGIRDCREFGPTSPKGPYGPPLDAILPEVDIAGEECLNLNIWTDVNAEVGSRPVMVWIHGGAFVNGSGSIDTYDGTTFAEDGVVCVTINYRLGADGFLFLDDGIANLGIQDQLFALEWVAANIAAFGGDPHRVTIAGESAGAFSVATLLSLERSKGLFRGAILQSGAGSHWITPGTARSIARYLAEALGVPETRAAFREVPIARLIEASAALGAEAQTMPDPNKFGEIASNMMIFEPVVDGDLIKAPPIDAIASGVGADVAVLIGTNSEEFNLFLVPVGFYDMINDDLVTMAGSGYGLSPDAIEVYRNAVAGGPPGATFSQIASDWFFRIPAIRLAEAHANNSGATYVYEFRWGSPLFDGKLGACHAVEIPFVFSTTARSHGLLGDTPPKDLEQEMHDSWVAFIKDLDPAWPAYEVTGRQVRIFGGSDAVESDPHGVTRQLWDGIR